MVCNAHSQLCTEEFEQFAPNIANENKIHVREKYSRWMVVYWQMYQKYLIV
jgi:hypothetical protein